MSSTTYLFNKTNILIIGYVLVFTLYLPGCDNNPEANDTRTKPPIKQIPGENDSIPADIAEKGEVLIAYSDCHTCHKEHEKSVGPAFREIAYRYPANKIYIEVLARKVIAGGSGNWGSPIMDSHPRLSFEHAKLMVAYILSMKNKP